jgi:hypothetical protein
MNCRNVVLSLAAVAMVVFAVATPAEAGGGRRATSAPRSFQTVRVTGDQGEGNPPNIVIFVSTPELLLSNQDNFYYIRKGGAYVPNGVTRNFIVPVGSGRVYVVPNTDQEWAFGPAQSTTYTVTKGTVNEYVVTLIEGDVNNPTITPQVVIE